MNCRRVNGLLSAYIDVELTGEEMLAVRAHLDECADCANEYEALLQTKRLLSSLASRAPRADMEELLRCAIEREERHPYRRWLETYAVNPLRSAWEGVAQREVPVRSSTLLAAMLCSMAGVWVASGITERAEQERHRPIGDLTLLSRVPLAPRPMTDKVISSGVTENVPAGFGADVATSGYGVAPRFPAEVTTDASLLTTDRYNAPSHFQAGFSSDIGFSVSIGNALYRNGNRGRRFESALLMR